MLLLWAGSVITAAASEQLQSQIEGVLDVELIRQEAEHGALDIRALTTSILGTTAVLCAFSR